MGAQACFGIPADLAAGSLRHSTGDRVKPSRKSRAVRARYASTSSSLTILGFAIASSTALRVTSVKVMRETVALERALPACHIYMPRGVNWCASQRPTQEDCLEAWLSTSCQNPTSAHDMASCCEGKYTTGSQGRHKCQASYSV